MGHARDHVAVDSVGNVCPGVDESPVQLQQQAGGTLSAARALAALILPHQNATVDGSEEKERQGNEKGAGSREAVAWVHPVPVAQLLPQATVAQLLDNSEDFVTVCEYELVVGEGGEAVESSEDEAPVDTDGACEHPTPPSIVPSEAEGRFDALEVCHPHLPHELLKGQGLECMRLNHQSMWTPGCTLSPQPSARQTLLPSFWLPS
jgi:hypothetical protein